ASAQEPFHYRLFSDPDLPLLRGFDLDAAAFWDALARCAREVTGRLPADARVIGVIATSQREGCVFVDADSQVLYAGPNLDAPAAILPPLRDAGSPAGRVTARAAAATGLPEGTPVFAGGADTQSALLGSGVWEAGATGAVLGTTAPVQMVTARPIVDPAAR